MSSFCLMLAEDPMPLTQTINSSQKQMLQLLNTIKCRPGAINPVTQRRKLGLRGDPRNCSESVSGRAVTPATLWPPCRVFLPQQGLLPFKVNISRRLTHGNCISHLRLSPPCPYPLPRPHFEVWTNGPLGFE